MRREDQLKKNDIFNWVKKKVKMKTLFYKIFNNIRFIEGKVRVNCFLHYDNNWSLKMSGALQLFYCDACHRSGDVIILAAMQNDLSQIDAVKWLIDEFKLKLPKLIQNNFDSLYAMMGNKIKVDYNNE